MHICINYYQGAYGPTIRIATQELSELIWIHSIISQLCNGTVSTVILNDFEGIYITGLDRIELKTTEKSIYPICVKRKNNHGRTIIIWSQKFDEWKNCEGLVEGLMVDDRSGHQYLVDLSDEKGGILIKLSHKE